MKDPRIEKIYQTSVVKRDNGQLAKSITLVAPDLTDGWRVEEAEVHEGNILMVVVKDDDSNK